MRLFEAIIDANHRAIAGDANAGLHPEEFADSLPIVALSCIDPRLNPLLPEVLGIPEEVFIWLRNAGNIITGPLSSTMRSLALACAVKGGREIVVIGHTDCQVRKSTVSELTSRFKALGIDRSQLPENLNEYFGLFASERQNVQRGVEHVRSSPIIGAGVPVHGLLVDIETGHLEWIVNGYRALAHFAAPVGMDPLKPASPPIGNPMLAPLSTVEWKTPQEMIGETSGNNTASQSLPAPSSNVASHSVPPQLPKSKFPSIPPLIRSRVDPNIR